MAELYGLELPLELPEQMRRTAAQLHGSHRLRATARPASDGLAVAIATEPFDQAAAAQEVRLAPAVLPGGFGAYKCSDRRLLERLGTGDSVPLILDTDGQVLEAAWANVWIIEGRHLVTPPADGRLLEGITRGLLLDLAPTLGLTAAAEPVTLERARRADTIFLTSSLRHAVPGVLAGAAPAPAAAATLRMIRTALGRVCWEGSSCELHRCRCAAAADTNHSNTRAKRGSTRHSS